jgi:myosin heavy subunit
MKNDWEAARQNVMNLRTWSPPSKNSFALPARPSSPTSLAKYASSAAQIENETLQDQVSHLQSKIRTLEDMLEDARAAAERDEVVVRERIKRYKDKEEGMKKEAAEARKEMERLVRAEEQTRQRLGEIEEAFRENHLTLENARAEIETLRGELAVSNPPSCVFIVGLSFSHSGHGRYTRRFRRSNRIARSVSLPRKEAT